jgi:hypothetical protein
MHGSQECDASNSRFLHSHTVVRSLRLARFRSLGFLFTTLLLVATCAPCSPGLIVCLHLVSIFSDLLFRSLQVSRLRSIYPGSIPVREESFPLIPSKLRSALQTPGHTRVLQSRFIDQRDDASKNRYARRVVSRQPQKDEEKTPFSKAGAALGPADSTAVDGL